MTPGEGRRGLVIGSQLGKVVISCAVESGIRAQSAKIDGNWVRNHTRGNSADPVKVAGDYALYESVQVLPWKAATCCVKHTHVSQTLLA
jgi:hypothetical protein